MSVENRKIVESPQRRRLLKQGLAGLLLAGGMAIGLSACGKSDTATSSAAPAASGDASAKPITVGFIYVGSKDDYGYNQSHAEGAAEVKKLPGVTVLEDENVAETKDCQEAMESMINLQGATLIFPTSFGYFNPHVKEVAKNYPAVTFLHAGGHVDISMLWLT